MNKLSQQELWENIQNFNFDDQNSSYPFSRKLATENNWSFSFTQQAIAEYRKFIFLCCISPTGASPSETVDKVWHLHLTYTKNYWEDFCQNTLQQDIHHHPSRGGPTEKTKHDNWYRETRQHYEATFKNPPPSLIWPSPHAAEEIINEDIYDAIFFKRVVLAFGITVFLFACAVNLYRTSGPDFLLCYALICVAALAAIWFTQKNKEQRLQQIVFANLPNSFSVYEITRFIYGPHRCYQTALVDLIKRGIIETENNGYKIISLPPMVIYNEKNPLLPQLISHYKTGDLFSYLEGFGLSDTDDLKHPAFEKLYHLSRKVDYPKFIIPGIVLLMGFARIMQGMANDKPVGFLAGMMIVFSGIALLILQMHAYPKLVKHMTEEYWERQNANGKGGDVIGNFSILGTVAIAGFAEYAFLTTDFAYYEPKNQRWTGGEYVNYSSSSCSGGGDGGGGCGGGCGGCGS